MLHIKCPSCGTRLEISEDHGGEKWPCLQCGQKILIPSPARNKTVLGEIERDEPEEMIVLVEEPAPARFHCPYCNYSEPPDISRKISTGGWIVFAVMLFVCLPLCWLGFFITKDSRVCGRCGVKLGGDV